MASNKQKKIAKRRGSQNAGRPRLEGDRFPGGQLKSKDIPPNQRVLELRALMLDKPDAKAGAVTAAENPMDLMLAKGWITEDQHQAGKAYAALVRRAGLNLPVMKSFNPERSAGGYDASIGDPGAMDILRHMWAKKLTPETSSVLNEVCVHSSWPQWVVYRIAGKPVPAGWDIKRVFLVTGLERVRIALGARSERATEQSESQRRAMAT